MPKVLFVCLGNICRSPMAEAIFNDKVKKAGLSDAVLSDSCGTANYHVDDRPDHRTIKVLKQNGIETHHLGRQFHQNDFQNFDYILAMDNDNLNDILKLAKNKAEGDKVSLMRNFDLEKSNKNVPDPYYGNLADFEEVFLILNRSIDLFLDSLKKSEI